MNFPEDKPIIELGYRPPLDEPSGPSTFRVFAGLVCALLCLVPSVAGLIILWLAGTAFLGFGHLGENGGPRMPPSGGIALLFAAVMCGFPAYVMFRMARRLFKGQQKLLNEPNVVEARIYQKVDEIRRLDVEAAIGRDQPDELLLIPIAVSLHSQDLDWAQAICIRLASHPHFNVRGNAVLGFGHLARRFRTLDVAVVKPLIEAGLVDADKYVRGQANAAADDVCHFLGWTLKDYEAE
jgi:hypothetical protein